MCRPPCRAIRSHAGMCTGSFLRHHQHGVCTHAFAEASSTDVGHSHELVSVLPESEEILPLCFEHTQRTQQSQELPMLQPTKQPDLCNRPRLEQYEVTPLASLPLANLGHRGRLDMLKSLKPECLPQVPQHAHPDPEGPCPKHL